MLRYWHWTGQNLLMNHYVSPPMGDILLPMRHYAEVVARLGPQYRDNDGSKITAPGSSGAQEMIWSHIDFQVTPEMHMREIRRMGDEALREAEAAMKTVKKNQDQAARVLNQMLAYKLLTEYYEKKVLAAIAALIYTYGGKAQDKAEAERLGDETVALYTVAANHIYETLDGKSGNMKGGWWDVQHDLPGLIEVEKNDRAEMAKLFKWPEGETQTGSRNSQKGEAKLGTTQQVK
jgi:hypothetical protein